MASHIGDVDGTTALPGRCLSLIGGTAQASTTGTLPPLPQARGEQTDGAESADWYNSSYIIAGL